MRTFVLFPFFLLVLLALSRGPLLAQGSTEEELEEIIPHDAHNPPLQLFSRVNPLDNVQEPFDVLHYDATLDLTAAPEKTMSGLCNITLVWKELKEPPPTFTFNLRDLVIDSVFYNSVKTTHETVGDPADATYHHAVLVSPFPSVGDTAVVTVYYSGKMTDEFGPGRWGGVSSSSGVLYAMGVGFRNNYVSTTQHWLPCYDHPSDKATFTGRFLVKPEMTVASNGLLIEKSEQDDGNILHVWNHIYPAATYLLTFAVAPYNEMNVGTPELPMLLYAMPNDSAVTKRTFALLPEMVSAYSVRYGKYPFEKVGYANTPQGAMEHQTMISYPTALSRRGDSFDLVIPHELAHQWFGDLVSPVDFRHAWLNESFATFSESVWLEELFGFESYLAEQEAKLDNYIQRVAPQEKALPLYDFSRDFPSSNYPTTIYDKGALVVGMLRYELGESRFFEAMRTYLNRYAYKTAGTDSLLAVCEEITGRELDWFFDQWVRQAGWPIYQIRVRNPEGQNQVQLHIKQIQPEEYGEYRSVPLEFSFLMPTRITHKLLRIDSMEQIIPVNVGPVVDVLVNQGPSLRTLAAFDLQITLGTDEKTELDDISYDIALNPSAGAQGVIIEREGIPSVAPTLLRLYDPSGRLVLSTRIDNFPFVLDTNDLSSGRYIFSLSQGKRTQSFLVFIQQ
ncbi:MAG: T9SS type A sorting domain-containing protein [Chlorobi bacterium]|nr:T9SS type A sorting domain-containing protein [Chlorobiota bacterium]